MAKRGLSSHPERFPTNAKCWKKLKLDWLTRLVQHLDNDWIVAVAGDGAEVDRGTLEAILHCAVGITPDTDLGGCRYAEELFGSMLELYNARGRPLRSLPLSHFQPCPATGGQFGESTSQPRQLGSSDCLGQASQANDEGPELAWTPDALPFLHMGQQSIFLLTKVQGGADDWMLGSCSLGTLVFSPSKGMAQLVSHILASPGHYWPSLPCPATLMQSVPQSQAAPVVPCSHVTPPASPQTPCWGGGSRSVPDLGNGRIMSPMSS